MLPNIYDENQTEDDLVDASFLNFDSDLQSVSETDLNSVELDARLHYDVFHGQVEDDEDVEESVDVTQVGTSA